jgi:molybdate transport system substrate-binding protein
LKPPPSNATLAVLSAGAAQAVVTALAARQGVELSASFGAVAAMREKLRAGEPCDLVVLTREMMADLESKKIIICMETLGSVATAVAVRESDPAPDVSSEEALRAALLEADAIYFPDPDKATAGVHFAKVLESLSIRNNLRTFPNGATAMREMARHAGGRVIGCTQATEILGTAGTRLVAPLPGPLALSTVYAAGVAKASRNEGGAREFLALLTGAASRQMRRDAGFEV